MPNPARLYRIFLTTLSQSPTTNLPLWKQIVLDPWYRSQLKICSLRVSRHKRGVIASEDIQQEAMLLLARSLTRRPHLGFTPHQKLEFFSRWMKTIIVHDCRQAARRLRRGPETIPLDETDEPHDFFDRLDRRIDLDSCLRTLPPEERFIVQQYRLGHSLEETADWLSISVATAHRRFQRGLALLKRQIN